MRFYWAPTDWMDTIGAELLSRVARQRVQFRAKPWEHTTIGTAICVVDGKSRRHISS